jgi:acyl-homoserine lactone acylase PvdQ
MSRFTRVVLAITATLAACLSLTGVAAAASASGGATAADVEQSTPSVTPFDGVPSVCCFNTVLPPGNDGFLSATDLVGKEAVSQYPPYSNDQISMYQNLAWGYQTLTDSTISMYFKNEDIGLPKDITSQVTPEPGVTIYYDSYGVPHIYGQTRAALMFGAGYALAQTRLFEADALRHVGRADVASFAGGANAPQDALQWAIAPYTEQDLDNQVTELEDTPKYHQLYVDGINYIDGINAYIAKAKSDPLEYLPGEYFALGDLSGPTPFIPADLIAIGSAIAGAEGIGGGTELAWTILMQDLEAKLGKKAGYKAFLDFHSLDDPQTPDTVRGVKYPYLTIPKKVIPASVGIPDPGSVTSPVEDQITSGSGSTASVKSSTAMKVMDLGERYGQMLPTGESNALLISAKDSASGHPIGVLGPQLGYFSPAILMEEQLVGPDVDAEGVGVPGVNQYVVMGHGEDYAWSATSGYEGVISTFAVPLCSPTGGTVTTTSDYYVYKGQCLQMTTLVRQESWKPNLADSTPAGSQTLTAYVTDFGIVEARGTVHGKPVVFTEDRSTYGHELDASLGFEMFNEPSEMTGPVAFEKAASNIGYAFNWLYLDSKHIAYYNAGLLPVHAKGTNPLYPTMSTYPWVGFNGATNTSEDLPAYDHPNVIDQPWITSWNNHEAAEYSSTDDLTNYSSVWRVQLLNAGIEADLKRGKMTLAELVQVMERAGLVDLRAWAVGPYLLKVLGSESSNPAVANAISELQAWIKSGSFRETTGTATGGPTNTTNYIDSGAVQLMDAWWPLLVKEIYESKIGTTAFNELETVDPTDQPPNNQAVSPGGGGEYHQGSAWDIGFYGTVQTDLEDVLGMHPKGALSLKYCGNGSLTACRAQLVASLEQAMAETPDQVYPGYTGTPSCAAGNQVCYSDIRFSALGALSQPLMSWINRPTFQQADEIFSHRPYPKLPACELREYPVVTITAAKVAYGHLTLSGTALARDCNTPPAHLVKAQVEIAGRWLKASGTYHWHLTFPHLIKAGRYKVRAKITDATDNTAVSRTRTLVIKTS